jgi:hypothetical protein
MSFDHLRSLCFSAAVFVALFFVGFSLSQHKLLWIDECFSQHVSVDNPSYADILTLHFPDGNKCPLYYVLQKINSNVFSFRYPIGRAQNSFDVTDVRSQIIVRIPSNIYMSLALACIFYYFTRFYSLFTAFYALAVALVSPMVWLYWVEARPYSLWFLLTTAQLLFYCFSVRFPKIKVNKFIYLTHFLLVLTTPGSILQISIVTLMLFFKCRYKKRQLIWAWLLPFCIFLIYYFLVPVYKFKTFNFFTCLFDAVMPERLIVYVLYALTAWILSKKRKAPSNTFFLPVFLLFFMSGCFILVIDLFNDNFQFGFFSRYLIYLAPVDIIMFSLASFDLWHWTRKNFWVCMNITIFLGGLVIIRGLMTYREILATALYLHSPGGI